MNRSSAKTVGTAAALAVYLIVLPWLLAGDRYFLGVVTTASALALVSLGVWLTFYIGRINIGQGAFALIGGYTAAIAITKLGLSFWLALPLAGLVAAGVGAILGWPLLRLRGVYFAMITLSLTEAVRLFALNASFLTNGATGITSIPVPGAVAPFGIVLLPDFAGPYRHLAFYYVAAILLVAGVAVNWRITTSRMGWLFRSLQQNEELAASIGVNVAKLRVIAYAIACFMGGVGGAFFTVAQQSIFPASFAVQDSVYLMLYCFLGGLGHVFGPVVGAFVLFVSFESLHGLHEYQPLIYSLLIIGLMLWLPNGLLSLSLPARLVRRRPAPAAGAPSLVTSPGTGEREAKRGL